MKSTRDSFTLHSTCFLVIVPRPKQRTYRNFSVSIGYTKSLKCDISILYRAEEGEYVLGDETANSTCHKF